MSLKSILILYSHLCPGLASYLFPSGFPNQTLYAFLFFKCRCYVLIHLIVLSLTILIIFERSSICTFSIFLLLLFSTLFSRTFSRDLSLSEERERVYTHPKEQAKLQIYIYIYWHSSNEQKIRKFLQEQKCSKKK
jgi:hypothetical protein